MGRRERLLASLMLTLYTFYFITNVSVTLHALSFGMLNSSVILFRRRGALESALGVAALTMAFSIHPVSLFAFPVYAYATGGLSIDVRKSALFGVGAVLFSLPLYLPIFLRSGLPNEIVPTQWGYFHTFGVQGLYFDMLFLFPLSILAIAYGFKRREKLNAAILLGLFIAASYVSYRANILLAVFLAGFFPRLFRKDIKDGALYALILLTLLLNAAFLPVIYSGVTDWCSWGSTNRMCESPMLFIAMHTPTQSRVAIDPELAHLEAYLGKRAVLADLYVEYADEDKFFAESSFFFDQNLEPLEPYGIDLLVLNDKGGVKRSLDGVDRVYDNGYIHVFRRPMPA
jgi:hypothetical protein